MIPALSASLGETQRRYGAFAAQIGDDDAVGVAGSNGDLIDADRGRFGGAGAIELFLHVEFVDLLDCFPMQVHLLGNVFDGSGAAAAADGDHEASGVAWIGGEPGEAFAFHAAPRTVDAAELELQEDGMAAAIQIA